MTPTKILVALLALAALQACGGNTGDDTAAGPASTPTAATDQGIFYVDFGSGLTGVYTFLEDGRMYGLDFYNGLAGQPWGQLSKTNSLQKTDSVHWADFIDDPQKVGAQTSGSFGRTFSGFSVTLSISGTPGSFTATAQQAARWASNDLRTLYGDPVAPADAAGSYAGYVRTVGLQKPQATVDAFTLDASGHLAITASGCSFAGTMSPHASTGVFDVTVTTSGTACTLQSTLAGVAVPLSVVDSKPQFALQLNTADALQSAVFIVTKQ